MRILLFFVLVLILSCQSLKDKNVVSINCHDTYFIVDTVKNPNGVKEILSWCDSILADTNKGWTIYPPLSELSTLTDSIYYIHVLNIKPTNKKWKKYCEDILLSFDFDQDNNMIVVVPGSDYRDYGFSVMVENYFDTKEEADSFISNNQSCFSHYKTEIIKRPKP